jgi:small subunit ribosomal protein S20
MANSPQAKKRVRQTARRTIVNAARKSRIRTFLRKVEDAIRSGDADSARAALQAAQPEIMRGASRGVMHKNTASRKIARLSHRVKTMKPA